jgi:hypothetical protein
VKVVSGAKQSQRACFWCARINQYSRNLGAPPSPPPWAVFGPPPPFPRAGSAPFLKCAGGKLQFQSTEHMHLCRQPAPPAAAWCHFVVPAGTSPWHCLGCLPADPKAEKVSVTCDPPAGFPVFFHSWASAARFPSRGAARAKASHFGG